MAVMALPEPAAEAEVALIPAPMADPELLAMNLLPELVLEEEEEGLVMLVMAVKEGYTAAEAEARKLMVGKAVMA